MMMMKSVIGWRKPEYPEETTDLRQGTDETFHTYGLCEKFHQLLAVGDIYISRYLYTISIYLYLDTALDISTLPAKLFNSLSPNILKCEDPVAIINHECFSY